MKPSRTNTTDEDCPSVTENEYPIAIMVPIEMDEVVTGMFKRYYIGF